MTYELITNRNLSEGLHVPIVYVNDITGGLFIPIMLFVFYLIIALGIYFNQKQNLRQEDMATSFAAAGFVTAVITTLLKLIPGLVNNMTYAVVIIVSVIGVVWFLFSRE